MNWFGYVWVVALVLSYMIWTIKCIIDFIRALRGPWKMSVLFEEGVSWGYWILLHGGFILLGSFLYFLLKVVRP